MPAPDPKNQPLLVTVVSKNPSTLQGLETYLRGVGVVTTTTGALERLVEMTPPAAAAVILFPDEYGPAVAICALAALRKLGPTCWRSSSPTSRAVSAPATRIPRPRRW